jgi:hypothetical protein
VLFIESRAFRRRVADLLDEDELAELQQVLAQSPERWPVIRGCGGARKARVAERSRGRGKRGGARVIYLHVPRWEHMHLLVIYGKHEADDLDPGERAVLRRLVESIRQEYEGRNPDEEGSLR